MQSLSNNWQRFTRWIDKEKIFGFILLDDKLAFASKKPSPRVFTRESLWEKTELGGKKGENNLDAISLIDQENYIAYNSINGCGNIVRNTLLSVIKAVILLVRHILSF